MNYHELIKDLEYFGISGRLVSVEYHIQSNLWIVCTKTQEHIYCMDDDK